MRLVGLAVSLVVNNGWMGRAMRERRHVIGLVTLFVMTVGVTFGCGQRESGGEAAGEATVAAAEPATAPVMAVQERPTEAVSPAPEVNAEAVVWRTPEPPANPEAGEVWVNPRDGMEMVYIAAGEFTLGTSDEEVEAWLADHPRDSRGRFLREQPQCRVSLEGYWIGRTEVTNAQYLRFMEATGYAAPGRWEEGRIPEGLEQFPVVFIDADDAVAYCEWAGGRLPSELEWEKAARGPEGRIFPWGEEWDSSKCRNFELIGGASYETTEESLEAFDAWTDAHDLRREGPVAVGSYPQGASPYGCLDMAGNVWEWCADRYRESIYQRYATGDLTPPERGISRVLRGGAWYMDSPAHFRSAFRFPFRPDFRQLGGYGFRCAREAAPRVARGEAG